MIVRLKVIVLFIIGCFCLGSVTCLAASKTAYSDSELRSMAEKELSISPDTYQEQEKSSATVSVAELLKDTAGEDSLTPWELSVSAQNYQPSGLGKATETETYNLNRLAATSLFGIDVNRWFSLYQGLEENGYRIGVGGGVDYASHTMKVHTNSGFVYDDVKLHTVLVHLAPVVEFHWNKVRNFMLGISPGVGSISLVQTSSNSLAGNSEQEWYYRINAYAKYYVWRTLFVKTAFEWRQLMATNDRVGLQRQNYILGIGTGL